MTSYVYLEISMVVIVEGVEIGCRCWNVGTSPPVGVRNIKTILNGRKQQLRDLMLWWPYILTQAKERRRRSAITHMSKSSLPSPERNGVEITSVRTKKTRVTCDEFMFHSLQMLSPGSAGSAFQWISEDQSLHSPQYETWLGLDRTRAPYSAPGIIFSSLTEQLRDSVVNSWDEIWETETVF